MHRIPNPALYAWRPALPLDTRWGYGKLPLRLRTPAPGIGN